jgi:uncharacterized phage protein (TIGR01671 family)
MGEKQAGVMREIKFRSKRVDNGEWVYGFYYAIGGYRYIHSVRKLFGDSWVSNTYQVDPATIGQFTGLRDKNGREIYEGDILQADDPKDKLTFSVKWYSYGGTNLLGINTEAFLVVGNIHDNPNLLKGVS